jgi:hypothetical protein
VLPGGWWRLVAGGAAAALVVSGRGDAALLAAALAMAAWTPWAAAGAGAAVAAIAVRWGTSDLAAIGGATGALGPAIRVGPTTAALACVLAGLALVAAAFDLAHGPAAGAGRATLGAGAALAFVGPTAVATTATAVLAGVVLVALSIGCALGGRRLGAVRAAGPLSLALALSALAIAASW